jgi:uncharacterized protein (TIGR02246 family)
MRAIVLIGCLMVATATAVAKGPAAAQGPARSADDAAVRDVVRQYVDARERRDPQAIGALFTADADQHTTAGVWRRGRAAIVPGTLASSQGNPGQRSIAVETVRFLTADVAIADGPYTIGGAGGAPARRMWATIVLVREDGTWRISAIRNMLPTAG